MPPPSYLRSLMTDMTPIRLKTILLSIVILLLSTNAWSRNGKYAAGVEGGYLSANHGAYASMAFQLSVVRHFRIEASAGYAFRKDDLSAFLFNLDAQAPIKLVNGVAIYPLVGATVNNWTRHGANSTLKLGANLGGGIDFILTHDVKLTCMAKYSVIKTFNGFFAGAGIAYLF